MGGGLSAPVAAPDRRDAWGAANETADDMGDLKRKVLNLINGADAAGPAVSGDSESRDNRDLPTIGSVLRSARVQAGLELRDVATMLKIRHVFMLAIEDGRYHELPGTAYAVGFVRAYADYLGLDGDAVVRRFKDEVAGKVSRQNLYFPTPTPEARVPGGTILLFSVILVCLVYGGWYVLSATDRSMVDVVPALPQRLVSLLEVFTHGSSGGTTTAPAPNAGSASAPAPAPASPPASADATLPPQSPGAPTPAPMAADVAPVLPGGVVLRSAPAVSPLGGVPSTLAQPQGPGALTAPASVAAQASEAAQDSGDEIPLVSGPADEVIGEPGPRVPMAPRTKPLPPQAGDQQSPAAESAPQATPAVATLAAPPASGAAIPLPPAIELPAPTGRIYGGQNHDSRVQIRAIQDAWVQVRDGNGDPVFTRVLHTGDVFRVPERQGMRLRTGNAGGLVAIVDGGEAQPLGAVGQVLRDVPIDAAHLPRGATAAN